MFPKIFLKPGKEKNLLARHPWIFSGAIARVEKARDGDTIDVCDHAGKWIARGYYNARSQIAARVWTWNDAPIDRAFFRARLERAITARTSRIDSAATNAYRLVNAESDFLPGIIADRYADFVVLQFLTLGADARKTEIAELIGELTNARGVYERSDVDVREKEGLASSVGVLRGDAPPDLIEIRENNFSLLVDVKRGHKTGLYLDQRENRARAARDLEGLKRPSRSAEILNVFSYTGGFSVYLGAPNADARIINLDASRDALELARANMRANDCEARGEFVEGDAFVVLRKYRDQGRSFDALILDPPKFVHAQSQLESGLRGYKDINLLAFKLLKPGGALVTFSCSGQVSAQMFQTVVFQAATDAHRDAQIIAKLSQSSDHPILLALPESEYLKGLVCRVM